MPSRLFIASVGNPGNLYNTLHSTGHLLADALQGALAAGGQPAFGRAAGRHVSDGAAWTLFKSSRYMNESGAAVVPAYRRWLAALAPDERASARLVLLHDELELAVGRVAFRSPDSSLRGHRGLRSVSHALGGRRDFARIAVGIGRPESRERQAVSDYVLAQISPADREKIVGRVDDVIDMLETLAKGG